MRLIVWARKAQDLKVLISIDYKAVLALGVLHAADQKFVRAQLVALPPRINVAKENEMGEMMGKLKDVSRLVARIKA